MPDPSEFLFPSETLYPSEDTFPVDGLLAWNGKQTLTDLGIIVNGENVSSSLHAVTLTLEREEIDVTPFDNPRGYRIGAPGLAWGTVQLGIYAGTPTLDASLQYAYDSRSPVAVQITPHNAPAAANNPACNLTCLISNYIRLEGSVGEAASSTVTMHSTGAFAWAAIDTTHYPSETLYPSESLYP